MLETCTCGDRGMIKRYELKAQHRTSTLNLQILRVVNGGRVMRKKFCGGADRQAHTPPLLLMRATPEGNVVYLVATSSLAEAAVVLVPHNCTVHTPRSLQNSRIPSSELP